MRRVLPSLLSAVVIVASLAAANGSTASAASQCDAHGIGNNTMTNGTAGNTAYKVSNGKATITFKVVGKGCKLPVTMIAWKAPNGTDGKPYDQQKIFTHVSDTFAEGLHQLTVALPDCYYQVDTVTGKQLTGSTGGAHNYGDRQVGYIHGGTQSCNKKPTPTPVAPTPASTQPTLTVTQPVPKKLTNTGPMSGTAVAGLMLSIAGGYGFWQWRARRQN